MQGRSTDTSGRSRRWRSSPAGLNHFWQPFSRPDELVDETSILWDRSEGVWLWNTEGRRSLNGIGAWKAIAIGHARVRLTEAAARQMRQLAFLDTFTLYIAASD